jgi:hypothetical protein
LRDRVPQKFEYALRHLRMPNQIVWLAKKFMFAVARDANEDLIRIRNDPFEIGLADDDLVFVKSSFTAGRPNGVFRHLPTPTVLDAQSIAI